jgi:hypothetical protein
MGALEARAADRAGHLIAGAELYEQAIAAGDHSLEVLMDLALLYWCATDPGLSAAEHFDAEFINRASRRRAQLLDEASIMFPASTAVRFWKQYIAWADLGEPFDIGECRRLLRECPSVLDPALYVFMASNGQEARAEASELLRRSREAGTTGARYVVSVLNSTFSRTGASAS